VALSLAIELERETETRWIAEIPALPGVMVYGSDANDAIARVEALALRVIADEIEHRERSADDLSLSFVRSAAA
jgi:predicted RNase H-like HicB family nuclease